MIDPVGVLMDQRLWVRWLEVAIEHEAEAKRRFSKLLQGTISLNLVPEYRAALVAITSSAFAIEAMHKELEIVVPGRGDTQAKHVATTLGGALSLSERSYQDLLRSLGWLFALRNGAVHPISELRPTGLHPADFMTGKESCAYNAVSSQEAVDVAVGVIAKFEDAETLRNENVRGWALRQQPYIVGALKDALDSRAARLVHTDGGLWNFR